MNQRPPGDSRFSSSSIAVAVSYNRNSAECVGELTEQLGNERFGFAIIFFSPLFNAGEICSLLSRALDSTVLYGCSTAGELTPRGIEEGAIIVIGFPAVDFAVNSVPFHNLGKFSMRETQLEVLEGVRAFHNNRQPDKPHYFALLLIDGLSSVEEQLVWAVYYGLKDIPLVGGSAGDGLQFKETKLIHQGQVLSNAGILLLVQSRFPFRLFKSDSLQLTRDKFVVTKASPTERVVYELNGLPAAEIYASAIGTVPSQLDLLSFSAHPLTVQVGDDSYVRSIQSVNEDGSFTFYSAVDEGIVFTLSEVGDVVKDVESAFADIGKEIGPSQIALSFDCVTRRAFFEGTHRLAEISRVYSANRVIGFTSYGEQFHGMHLNQTFTGIVIGK